MIKSIMLPCCAAFCLHGLVAQDQALSVNLTEWMFSQTEMDAPDAQWEKVTVPHCWNAADAQQGGGKEAAGHANEGHNFGYYRGPGSYKTTFPTAWDPDKNAVFIRFNAVSSAARVALNGRELGEHLGAFTAFGFNVTHALNKDGGNELTVAASNAYRKDILPISGDFPLYGGMYRPVTIEIRPKVCISPIVDGTWGVRTYQRNVSEQSATLEIAATLHNGTGAGTKAGLSFQLKDKSGKTVTSKSHEVDLAPGDNEISEILQIDSPTLWDGRTNPYLYDLVVQVKTAATGQDSTSTPVGFRYFGFDPDKGFTLNGKSMKSFGVCLHQDWQGVGWALTPVQIKTNAEIMEDIGANMARLAHYPHAQEMVAECDRRGILVWCEIPFVDTIGKPKIDGVEEVTRRQLVEMIRQNINHPSIMTWGLGNELFHRPTDDPLPLLRELNKLAKQEDPTRLTTVAVNRPGNKELCSISDLLGLNAYPGWYGGSASGMKGSIGSLHKSYPQTPVGISEYGHGGSISHHERDIAKAPAPAGKWHPEEYQSRGHEKNWEAIAAQDMTWGTFIWNLCDFASVWRDEGDAPGINDKGLVTFDRKIKKDAYYFYKANWRTDIPVLHIQEKRATPTRQKEVKIRFYSNLDDHTVTLNGKPVDAIDRYTLNGYETTPQPLQPGANTVIVTGRDGKGQTVTDKVTWVLREES